MMINIFSDRCSIFMMHRVAPYNKENLVYNENMKISPAELEGIIQELIKDGRNFISIDQVAEVSRVSKIEKKSIVFTLDDGYRDNLEYAYPIFKKYNIPFCIYITNSFPEKTTSLWWYALEKLILQNKSLIISGRKEKNQTTNQQKKNFLEIRRQIIDTHFRDPIQFMHSIGDLKFDLAQEIKNKCLSWQQIKELSMDPLVTIGCHTANHFPLSKLPENEVRSEMESSKVEIENRIGKSVRHFAFPFGTKREASAREYKIAAELGFETVVTAIHGHVVKNENMHRLNRVFLLPLSDNRTTLKRIMYWNLKSFYNLLVGKMQIVKK